MPFGDDIPTSYWYDQDGDGYGAGPAHEYCAGAEPAGWVDTNSDQWPECSDTGENPYDSCGVCNGPGPVTCFDNSTECNAVDCECPSGYSGDGLSCIYR